MNKTVLAIALASFLSACGGGGSSASSPQIQTSGTTCAHEAQIRVGDYVVKNMDGSGNTKVKGSSCITAQASGQSALSGEFAFDYVAPDPTNGAVTWQAIVYGYNPMDKNPVISKLPKLASTINSVAIDYNISALTPTGGGALFWDVTLCSTAKPAGLYASHGCPITIDIDLNIWGDLITDPRWSAAWDKAAQHEPIVVIDGVQYYFGQGWNTWEGPNSKGPDGNYKIAISFVRVDAVSNIVRNGTINIKSFLDYLITNNIMSNNLYLTNVEFGLEVVYGKGNIKINNYEVKVN